MRQTHLAVMLVAAAHAQVVPKPSLNLSKHAPIVETTSPRNPDADFSYHLTQDIQQSKEQQAGALQPKQTSPKPLGLEGMHERLMADHLAKQHDLADQRRR